MYECGIRSVTEYIHAYSEGLRRSPEEYGTVGGLIKSDFIMNSMNKIRPFGVRALLGSRTG